MAGDPADVGGTPEGVLVAQVEDEPVRIAGHQQVAGGGVQHAFGFAGAAAGVEDEQRMLAVERFGRAVGRSVGHQFVPPKIAAGLHLDRLIAAIHDHAFLDCGRFGQRGIDVLLQRHDLAAPPAAVGRDDQLRLGVVVALGHGVGGEAGEDDRVCGPDARTSQHGDGGLGNERHVDGDAVAGLDAELLEGVGELADFAVQVLVAQHARIARLAFEDDRRLVAPPRGDVPIEAVEADVELAADEPLGERLVPLQHLGPFLGPGQRPCLLGPEAGLLPKRFVLGQVLEVGLGGKLRRRGEAAGFLQDAGDVGSGRGHRGGSTGGRVAGMMMQGEL